MDVRCTEHYGVCLACSLLSNILFGIVQLEIELALCTNMNKALQTKVKDLRKKSGLTLDALAEATGISKSYLWEIENRKEAPSPSAEKLGAIAGVFGVTVDFLLHEEAGSPEERHLDEAFFRNYSNLEPEDRERVRKIVDSFRKG